ncbi:MULTISPECIES: tRNA (adenine(9)-N1)-methyltransferase Trm10 [Acidianus]|uniref:tRNA (Guanine-N1)-methyltransferase n=1 Tax=Candidatus Acidianus copahuensis TaxID=1160895 RepID=A0A031LMJ0_9CREN|nr:MULTISPECIES: tRNA (adenine(9)-N1)-methyltransferase Trm10 [Acidianus]EZQ04716.1 tRNA (guanine-N1)-methyltransferase [Candidatus Acidianus copahuensis]NON63163.1 tRNA (guanine-N1)-methyltransferase [Acidianus sp. RZ1]
MILGEILGKRLNELGINKIYFKGEIKRNRTILQNIAVNVLLKNFSLLKKENRGKIMGKEFGITILSGKGVETSEYEIWKGEGEKILIEYPKVPTFIIDLSLWERHVEDERSRLKTQILCSLNAIRNYLWDYNLAINNYPKNFSLNVPNNLRKDVIPDDSTIVLDPYGDVEATEEILRKTNYFIIGGIVDKSGWKEATKELSKKAGYDFPHVRISLRGSTVGVPDRINRIIEIIMKIRLREKIEEAILEMQTNSDKFSRLVLEASRGNYRDAILWLKPNDKVLRKFSQTRLGSSFFPQSASWEKENS